MFDIFMLIFRGLFQTLILHSVNDPLVRGTDFDYEQVNLVWHEATINDLLTTGPTYR